MGWVLDNMSNFVQPFGRNHKIISFNEDRDKSQTSPSWAIADWILIDWLYIYIQNIMLLYIIMSYRHVHVHGGVLWCSDKNDG